MANPDDLKIICDEDCGNAPKKELLKEFNIAFAKNDIDLIVEDVTDDVTWNIIGDKRIQGKDDFTVALRQMNHGKAVELHISNIITHGKTASTNGILKFSHKKSSAFCDVYVFSSAGKDAKIKEITSYVIEVP